MFGVWLQCFGLFAMSSSSVFLAVDDAASTPSERIILAFFALIGTIVAASIAAYVGTRRSSGDTQLIIAELRAQNKADVEAAQKLTGETKAAAVKVADAIPPVTPIEVADKEMPITVKTAPKKRAPRRRKTT